MNIGISKFSENVFEFIKQVVGNNEIVKVCTQEGNAVILSEEDYNGLIASLELSKDLRTKSEILKCASTPIEECIPEDDIEW